MCAHRDGDLQGKTWPFPRALGLLNSAERRQEIEPGVAAVSLAAGQPLPHTGVHMWGLLSPSSSSNLQLMSSPCQHQPARAKNIFTTEKRHLNGARSRMLCSWGELLAVSGFQVCQNSKNKGQAWNVTALAECLLLISTLRRWALKKHSGRSDSYATQQSRV